MLQRGVIEPSTSAWASNLVLVAKPNGTTRACVDYRMLNAKTTRDAYPLPRIDECLDSLSDACWFSTMDLNSGFWQIEMSQDDKEKTAFVTTLGLFQFRVMPFGLVNAPSTFERLMECVLKGLQWTECLVYMDDIISYSHTFDEGLKRLATILVRLKEANLKLKPGKCIFFQKQVKFLGHIVSSDGIQTEPEKISAVKNWPVPRNAKQIRSFLGLCSYYRRFVKNFAEIAKPLHELYEKNTKFLWTPECQKSFESLKDSLTSSPILGFPIPSVQFILDTDASNQSVGAVLSQDQNGTERVVAYMSQAMNRHQKSYCVTRKELLAVVTALRKFHHYLYGQDVLLRTDNAAVSWVRNLKNPTGQMARWLQEIETFNLTVTHRPGRKHQNADALSRSPCKVCAKQEANQEGDDTEDSDSDVMIPVPLTKPTEDQSIRVTTRRHRDPVNLSNQEILEGWNPEDLKRLQMEDPSIGLLLINLTEGKDRPKWDEISHNSSAFKVLWRQWERLKIVNGILYREFLDHDSGKSEMHLIVPEKKKSDVLHYFHDIPTAAHLGAEKMTERIKHSFYWPSMSKEILNYCKSCDLCVSRKTSQKSNKAPLGQYLVGEPMERVALDVLGPLPVSNKGNKYILVMSDCFTKWTEAIAIPDQESRTIITTFINEIVCRFGTPLQIHSDQGRNFESKAFKDMCEFLHIDKTRTSSMRPQANGSVERFNRTLATMLTMFCEQEQKTLGTDFPQVMMAYRASVNSSTGKTPNLMMLG